MMFLMVGVAMWLNKYMSDQRGGFEEDKNIPIEFLQKGLPVIVLDSPVVVLDTGVVVPNPHHRPAVKPEQQSDVRERFGDGGVLKLEDVRPGSKTAELMSAIVAGKKDGVTALEDHVKEPTREVIHFLHSPRDYFAKQFSEFGLDSPVREIWEDIDRFRNNLPKISQDTKLPTKHKNASKRSPKMLTPADMILLQSPLEHVRESTIQGLIADKKFTREQLDGLFIHEPGIVDVAFIDYAKQIDVKIPNTYFSMMEKVINELWMKSENARETQVHISRVCEYLTMFTEAEMYRHGTYRINNPRFLDQLVQKFEPFLSDLNESEVSQRMARSLLDLVSHFELNNDNALGMFDEVLEKTKVLHPLKNLVEFMKNETETGSTMPQVGLELEVVPRVFMVDARLPNGFSMGFDGGWTMPEMRRIKKDILFGKNYKKDLYDLWHWCRMGRVMGASVHVTLDDDANHSRGRRFRTVFGWNESRAEYDSHGQQIVVELRLPLRGFMYDGNKDKSNSLKSVRFDSREYDLVPMIGDLITLAEAKSITVNSKNEIAADGVIVGSGRSSWLLKPDREYARFACMSTEELFERIIQERIDLGNEERDEIILTLDILKSREYTLSLEKARSMILHKIPGHRAFLWKLLPSHLEKHADKTETLEWLDMCEDLEAYKELLRTFDGTLTIEEIRRQVVRSRFYPTDSIYAILADKINEPPRTVRELKEVYEQIKGFPISYNFYAALLGNYNDTLTLDEVCEIVDVVSGDKGKVIEALISKIDVRLFSTSQELFFAAEKSGWNVKVFEDWMRSYRGTLTREEFWQIDTKFENASWILKTDVLDKLSPPFTDYELFAQLMKIPLNVSNSYLGTLTVDQVFTLGDISRWDYSATQNLLGKLSGEVTFEQLVELANKSFLKYENVKILLDAYHHELTMEQAEKLLDMSEEYSAVADRIIDKLPTGSINLGDKLQRKFFVYLISHVSLDRMDHRLLDLLVPGQPLAAFGVFKQMVKNRIYSEGEEVEKKDVMPEMATYLLTCPDRKQQKTIYLESLMS